MVWCPVLYEYANGVYVAAIWTGYVLYEGSSSQAHYYERCDTFGMAVSCNTVCMFDDSPVQSSNSAVAAEYDDPSREIGH